VSELVKRCRRHENRHGDPAAEHVRRQVTLAHVTQHSMVQPEAIVGVVVLRERDLVE
jgi:hypothetical protein